MSIVNHETNFYAFYPDDPYEKFFEDGVLNIQEDTDTKLGEVSTPDRWSDLDPYMFWYDNCFNNLWNCMTQPLDVNNTYIRDSKTSWKWLRDCNYAFNQAGSSPLTGKVYVGQNVREANHMFANAYKLQGNHYFGENLVNCQNMYENCNNLNEYMDIPSKVKNLDGCFYSTRDFSTDMFGCVINIKSDSIDGVRSMFYGRNETYPSYKRKAMHIKVNPDTTTNTSFSTQSFVSGKSITKCPDDMEMGVENLYVHYDPEWKYEQYPLRELRLYKDLDTTERSGDWGSFVSSSRMTGGIYLVEGDMYRYQDNTWGVTCVGVNMDGSQTTSRYGLSMSMSYRQTDLRPHITPDKICFAVPSIYWSDINGVYPPSVTFYGDMNNAFTGATSLTEVPYIQGYKNCYYGVNNAADMFNGLTGIVSIDPEVRDFSNAKDITNMFYNCYRFTTDLSGTLFTVAEDASGFMWNCTNLTGIPALPNVTNLYQAFDNCVNAYTDISSYTWQNCLNFVSAFNRCENVHGTATIPDKAFDNFTNSFRMTNISKFVFETNIEDMNGTFAYDDSVRNVIFNKDVVSGKGHTQEEFKTHIIGMFGRTDDAPLDIWLPNYATSGMSLLRQVLVGDWQQETGRYAHDSKCFGRWNEATGTYDNRVIFWTDDTTNRVFYNTELKVNMHYGPMV